MEKDLIHEKLAEHESLLEKHSEEIGELKTKTAVSDEKITNLCKSLDGLCNKIQVQNGIILTGIVTLIIYMIQKFVFKA